MRVPGALSSNRYLSALPTGRQSLNWRYIARAMSRLRSRMRDEQRTRRRHREPSRKITAQGSAWNYRRADFARAIRICPSTDTTRAKIELALNTLLAHRLGHVGDKSISRAWWPRRESLFRSRTPSWSSRFRPTRQAAELSAKLARTILRAMRNVSEIMVLSSLLACVHRSSNESNLRALFPANDAVNRLRAEVAAGRHSEHQRYVRKCDLGSSGYANR